MAQYAMRIDDELFEKLKIISETNSRSINKQIEFVLKQFISDYEKANGTISLEEE